MFNRIRCSLTLASSLLLAGVVVAPQLAQASQAQSRTARAEHAVAGKVTKVDHAARTVVIHTTDGVDETIRFTERTVVRGAEGVTRVADATAKASLEGWSAVVHYTGDGADKTAMTVDRIGQRTLTVARGTVVLLDEAGKFVIIKTAAGAEETYRLTRDVVIDTLRGLEDVAAVASHGIRKGADVTVHYADEGGNKVAYLIRHL
jgi:arginine repressor